jgi:hypothetical protein
MHVETSVALGRNDPTLEIPWASADGRIRYHDLRSNPALINQITEANHYPQLREFLLRINAAGFFLQTAKSDIWMTDQLSPEEDVFAADRKLVSYVDLIFSAADYRTSFERHEALAAKLSQLLGKAPDLPASTEFVIRHCLYHDSGSVKSMARKTKPGDDLSATETSIENGPRASPTLPERELAAKLTRDSEAGTALEGKLPSPAGRSAQGCSGSSLGFSISAYTSGFGTADEQAGKMWQIALTLLEYAMLQIDSW